MDLTDRQATGADVRASQHTRRFYVGLLRLCLVTLLLQAAPPPLVRGLWLGYVALTLYITLALPGAGRAHRSLGLICTVAELLWLAGVPHPRTSGQILSLLIILFISLSQHKLVLCLAAERRVDGTTMAGATAGYLLMGLTGGLLLTLLAGMVPGGFRDSVSGQSISLPPISSLAEATLAWDHHFQQINYFAFVSLTTVGYGDITPSVPILQLASVSLSVLGPLYLAVVLGVLISRVDTLTILRSESPQVPTDQPKQRRPCHRRSPWRRGRRGRSRVRARPDRAPGG